MKNFAVKVLECARRSIGVREETSNWGKWVSTYLKFVGINFPAAWCIAFISYKVHQAAWELKVKTKWPRWSAAGRSATALYEWAKKEGRLLKEPIDNCVFLVPSPTREGIFIHGGFVEFAKSKLATIEGNTNNDGSSEGIGVFERTRGRGRLVFICLND